MSKDFKVKNGLQVTTHITSSGNISASGNVLAVSMSADAFNGDGSGLTNVSAAPDAASITGSSTALSSSLAGRTATLEANPVGKSSATISGSFTVLSSSLAGRTATLEANPVGKSSATISGSWRGELSSSAMTVVGGGVSGSSTSSGSFGRVTAVGNIHGTTLISNELNISATDTSEDATHYILLKKSGQNLVNVTNGISFNPSSDTMALGGGKVKLVGQTGHISASAISASGTATVQNLHVFSPASTIKIGENVAGNYDGIAITGQITSSGNLHLEGDIRDVRHISASGDISASGTLDANAVTDGLAAAVVSQIDNGEIAIAKLAEDAITIAGTETDLGGSITSAAILFNGKATVSGSFTALSSSIAGRAATLEANPVGKSSATISGSSTALSSSIAGRVTTNETKLSGIENNADVTDTSNVTSAGALMDSEVASLTLIKTITATTISGSSTALSSSLSGRTATLEANPVGKTSATISGSFTALSSSIAGRAATLEGNPVYTSATISGSSTTLSSSIAARAATLEGNVGQAVNTDSDVTFGDVSIGESLIHTGDTDTKIQFTTDVITLIAGDETLLTVSEGATDRVSIGGAVNTNLWVSSSGDTIVNSDTTGSLSTHVGAFSVNYGDATKITGSLTADGVGYGDIVKFGGTTGLTPGACVYLKSDGSWGTADATGGNAAAGMSGSLLGIAMGANSDVDGVLLRGFVEANSVTNNIVGHKIYVLAHSAGRLTGNAPSSNGNIVRVVGYSLTSHDEIYFNPDNTYIEVTA